MSAFNGKSKLSQDTAKPALRITRRNNTTGSSPLPFRITEQERLMLQQWIFELQKETNKKITVGKLLRGLIHLQQKINKKHLIESIHENT